MQQPPRLSSRGRPISADELVRLIVQIYDGSHQTYGAVRVNDELREEHGVRVGRKRVARLMRQRGIKGIPGQGRTRRTTIPDAKQPPAPDLVERRFVADRPNMLWLADIERHEALSNRAVVKGHRLQPVAAGW
jgi:putative transposase